MPEQALKQSHTERNIKKDLLNEMDLKLKQRSSVLLFDSCCTEETEISYIACE